MFNKHKVKIHFAHRTFAWTSEAKGKANVHCVIIGFTCFDVPEKRLFDYENPKALAHETKVQNINPYLLEGKDIVVAKRSNPICGVPEACAGNKPVDYNNLKIEADEYQDFITKNPESKNWIKKMVGADEFINGKERYCLWFVGCPPNVLRRMPMVLDRVEKCKQARLLSKDKGQEI
jgi:hypothetical protein